ncbi:MAG: hypothetical protein MUC56_18060 [Thermoanaerobaculales bacterium]|jgi:outer membrane murein-binding lipoprotein Lpp|nr:hypothetical protein [Thermoanaerobaculales bacterium]
MNRLLCVAVIVAVAALVGCAKPAPAPTESPDVQTAPAEATPISTEDFESGEADGAHVEEAEPEGATTAEKAGGSAG